MSDGLKALELLKALPKVLSIGCETTMRKFNEGNVSMIKDYDIKYSENAIVKSNEYDFERPITKEDLFTRYSKLIEDYILFASITKKYMKVKGDMLVMENISRNKNKKDFEEMEKFLNEHKRKH